LATASKPAAPCAKLAAITRDADQPATYSLRLADLGDAPEVADLVKAAYRHYMERVGRLPGPMTEDYAAVIRDRQVTVAESLARSSCDRALEFARPMVLALLHTDA
jgi:hypothetical protein